MPRKFKRVLRKGYGYSKSKPKPIKQQSHLHDDEAGGFTKTMCNSGESEDSIICFNDMGIQTDNILASSDAEIQTVISVNPNCYQIDFGIQCAIDDEICEEQECQTDVSINPSTFPVHTSIQCNMLDEIGTFNKENMPLDNLCIGNNDEKFYPLVQKHSGTFKDLSGMYCSIEIII